MDRLIILLIVILISGCGGTNASVYQKMAEERSAKIASEELKSESLRKSCLSNVDGIKSAITPTDFFLKLKEIDFQKNEYESSIDYNSRIYRELSKHGIPLGKHLYVKKKFDPNYIQYDADRKVVNFSRWGVSNHKVKCSSLYKYGTDLCGFDNKEINLDYSEISNGSYIASNAFGVTANVTKIEHSVKGLLEGALKRDYSGPIESSIWTAMDNNNVIFQFRDVEINTAKWLKDNTEVVIGFQLKTPFLVVSNYRYEPTIKSKTERNYIYEYAMADIQCAALTDTKSNLLITQKLR